MSEAIKESPLWNLEKNIDKYWTDKDIVSKFLSRNRNGKEIFFTEGPPTANGKPHIGHVLTRSIKDAILRYKWLKGYRVVPFIAGWDCHGLPVEVEVEKELKLRGKKDIESMGIEKFNLQCSNSVYKYKRIWEEMSRDVAYWLNYDNAYTTMSPSYIESVWWALKEFFNRGLLEEGYRVGPYCPRCQTTLSSHEVAQGYKEVEDESIYVKVKLTDENAYVLIWTTTPWTLPSNMFVALDEREEYSLLEIGNEKIYVSTRRASTIEHDRVIKKVRGAELKGKRYIPIYRHDSAERIYYIVHGDFLNMDEGSGFVHIAPSYGVDDFEIGTREKVVPVNLINTDGKFVEGNESYSGKSISAVNKIIIKDLDEKGMILKHEIIKHTYPFCWRCNTPLIYYLQRSWFIKTSAKRDLLVSMNEQINWIPENIKEGRFGNFLTEAKDWSLSRTRYWGTPLPVWKCPDDHKICVGSVKELSELSVDPVDLKNFDPHIPYIDGIKIKCNRCGKIMTRVPYVIDCWFDSGSAPFAQIHYPFENREMFESLMPMEFISEAIDQTRGWFYSMHAISSMLFEKPAYKNVIVLGHILDKEGKKMSKSKGNAVEPSEAFRLLGADAVRLYFYTTRYTLSSRFSPELVRDSATKTILLYLNTLNFFKNNASIDHYMFEGLSGNEPIDLWLISMVKRTVKVVNESMDRYDLKKAADEISMLIEHTSNWYIRRSRDRFWGGGKNNAYSALFYMLQTTALLLAPFTPHVGEYVYQELVPFNNNTKNLESVMFADYPACEPYDKDILSKMDSIINICEIGRKLRQESKIKLRQPIPEVVIVSSDGWIKEYSSLISEELNCKKLVITESMEPDSNRYRSAKIGNTVIAIDPTVNEELFIEGLAREVIRRIQIERKELNMQYDKTMSLYIDGSDNIKKAVNAHKEKIMNETLCRDLRIAMNEKSKKLEVGDETIYLYVKV